MVVNYQSEEKASLPVGTFRLDDVANSASSTVERALLGQHDGTVHIDGDELLEITGLLSSSLLHSVPVIVGTRYEDWFEVILQSIVGILLYCSLVSMASNSVVQRRQISAYQENVEVNARL